MRFSINCSIVICSPTVEFCYHERSHYRNLWPPGLFSTYQSTIYFTVPLLLSVLISKNTKNIKLSYLSYLTFVSDRKGIDNPLSRWLRSSYLFVQVRGTRAWYPTGLIPWFSKTEGNTYATVLHHPFLFEGIQRKLEK